jgi:hypothetical protein
MNFRLYIEGSPRPLGVDYHVDQINHKHRPKCAEILSIEVITLNSQLYRTTSRFLSLWKNCVSSIAPMLGKSKIDNCRWDPSICRTVQVVLILPQFWIIAANIVARIDKSPRLYIARYQSSGNEQIRLWYCIGSCQ